MSLGAQANQASKVAALSLTPQAGAKRHNWRLLEMVHVAEGVLGGEYMAPLQLQRCQGKTAPVEGEENSALWLVAGFNGPGKNDTQILQLLERAVSRGIFQPGVDIYLCSLCSPNEHSEGADSAEARTLLRWADMIKPKAIVSFSNGASMIRHLGAPHDMFSKLAELAERDLFAWGTETQSDDTPVNNLSNNPLFDTLSAWASSNNVHWIDFSIDPARKNFADLTEQEWRPCVGPALKWLVEGPRFNPPKIEVLPSISHTVVPVLDLPPEFANL